MSRDISDELTDLELRMLKAIDIEWDRWQEALESGAPLPATLANLMVKTHQMLVQRVAKMGGEESLTWGAPEQALLRIERIRAALVKQIEQKNRLTS